MLDQLPTIIDSLGEVRVLGTLPTPRGISLPMWADSNDILPESDWQEFELVAPEVKIKDQDQRGACFPAGTRVQALGGKWNRSSDLRIDVVRFLDPPIEDICVGDLVLTAEGNIGTVADTFRRQSEGPLRVLTFANERTLAATPEHPVRTEAGYRRIDALRPGDRVAMPWLPRVGSRPPDVGWPAVVVVGDREFSGPVYNLKVTGDNSYIADGFGVHNCNGHAAATSLEIARWIAGYEHVDLSAWLIYADLCGGVDRGSSIGEALKLLQEKGTCTDVRVPWRTINPRAIGPDARAECPRFRIEVGKMQSDFAQLMTATQLRRPGNFSIFVGRGFNDLDADGCPPAVRGMGNHAVTYGLGAKKSASHGWLIKCQNSWSAGWGKGGYFWIHEGHLKNQAFFEAYEVMAAYADPQDPHKPPVVA
jgi:hypothetical protein